MKMIGESSPEKLGIYEEVLIRKNRVGHPWKQKTSKPENPTFTVSVCALSVEKGS